jgi:putative endopeptidase
MLSAPPSRAGSHLVAHKKVLHSVVIVAAAVLAPTLSAADDVSGETVENFGFPLSFAPVKMDDSAKPGSHWADYAKGRWYSAAVIPDDDVAVSPFRVLIRRVDRDLGVIVQDAAQDSGEAEKGTPLQQVGDFYTSGMDTTRIEALGVQHRWTK